MKDSIFCEIPTNKKTFYRLGYPNFAHKKTH